MIVEERAWGLWLDDLQCAAEEFERRLAAGDMAFFPCPQTPPAVSPGIVPAGLLARAATTLDRLQQLTRQAETHRDAIAGELASLCRPKRRLPCGHGYEMGAVLDVAG